MGNPSASAFPFKIQPLCHAAADAVTSSHYPLIVPLFWCLPHTGKIIKNILLDLVGSYMTQLLSRESQGNFSEKYFSLCIS